VPDLDNDEAEAEWMSAEGAKTATFVPDAAMLDSPDLTPVAPELPQLDDEESIDVSADDAPPVPDKANAAETPAPRLFDLPSPVPAKTPLAASAEQNGPSLPPFVTPPAKAASPAWAMDLEGTLKSPGDAPSLAAPSVKKDGGGRDSKMSTPPGRGPGGPAAAPPTAAPAPPGLPERRQPPMPDAVQMAAFSPEAPAAAPSKPRTGRILTVIILLLAIAGIAYNLWARSRARVPQAVRVRVLSPKPAAVYRWFSGRGTVTDHEARTLSFDNAGTLSELLPPGTAFVAGDILGRLRGAQPIEALLSRHRARVAFYEQMRDSMRAANNQPELRQAEIKLADKQRLIDESNASLAKLVVRATEPGEVVETLAKVGMPIKARAPIVRVKGRMLHGEFDLDADEIASADKLQFCRVEVVGLGPRASNDDRTTTVAPGTAADVGSPDAQVVPRFVDCTLEKTAPAAKKLRVTLPDNLGLVPGQPLRLARQRYDAVFPVPAALVSGGAERRSVWIAGARGVAERRDVVVADAADDALVSEGLRVGDEVIVDAPADLREGAAIVVER
jgi:multidrug efflux pump subunit AcrA (membrane-fusion protein)